MYLRQYAVVFRHERKQERINCYLKSQAQLFKFSYNMLDKLLKIIPFASLLALWCVRCRSFKKKGKARTHNFTLILSFLSTMFKFSIPEPPSFLPAEEVTLLAEPTISFSSKRFAKFSYKEMYEKSTLPPIPQASASKWVTLFPWASFFHINQA